LAKQKTDRVGIVPGLRRQLPQNRVESANFMDKWADFQTARKGHQKAPLLYSATIIDMNPLSNLQ
jgi:hypothetical protein